jgi:hypothetical protein
VRRVDVTRELPVRELDDHEDGDENRQKSRDQSDVPGELVLGERVGHG